MKKNIKTVAVIIVAIIVLYFVRDHYSSFNIKKTTQACMMAQKKINPEMTRDEIRKICDDYVRSQLQK